MNKFTEATINTYN